MGISIRGGGGSAGGVVGPFPTGLAFDPVTGNVVLTLSNGSTLSANVTSVESVANAADFLALPTDIGQQVLVTSTGELWEQVLEPVTNPLSWVRLAEASAFNFVSDAGGTFTDQAGNLYVAVPGP